MNGKIRFNLLFKRRKNFIVVGFFLIIGGLFIGQNYFLAAYATHNIQQQVNSTEYDVGGITTSDRSNAIQGLVNASMESGILAESVDFTVIVLPHVNFTILSPVVEDTLVGNITRTNLESGALLYVSQEAFTTRFADEFNLSTPVHEGIYLEKIIGANFSLPSNNFFNFSLGCFFEEINTSSIATDTNFTAITQNIPCRGYFEFNNDTYSIFPKITASLRINYYILCVGNGESVGINGLTLPQYYVNAQQSIFLLKINANALRVDNFPQQIQQISSSIFTNFDGFYFNNAVTLQSISDSITAAYRNIALESIPFFIIWCIFMYWLFSAVKAVRLNANRMEIVRGVSRKATLGSYAFVEILLAGAGAIGANATGILVGYVIYTLNALGELPFFLSITSIWENLLAMFILNLIFVGLFSIPAAVKLLRANQIPRLLRVTGFRKNNFAVKGWHVLGCAIIFTFAGISLTSSGPNDLASPLFPLMVINTALNPILMPEMPFLLSLGGMWLCVVIATKLQQVRQRRVALVHERVESHLQRNVTPGRRTFVFLLIIGITSATLIAAIARVQSSQARNEQVAFGKTGGTFQVGTSAELQNQFPQLFSNILNLAQSVGFTGNYDVISTTEVGINGESVPYLLHFIDPWYFKNLAQLTDDFFYVPNSKVVLDYLQENCALLPFYFHYTLRLNINDNISVNVVKAIPYNGTDIPIILRVVGFYFSFPGVESTPYNDPIICSNLTLRSFQNEAVVSRILFDTTHNASEVIAALNSTYGNVVTIATFQGQWNQIQADSVIDSALSQFSILALGILLFGEFSLAFITIVLNDRPSIMIQRCRGEPRADINKRYVRSYGLLLITGLIASIGLSFLASALQIHSLNTNLYSGPSGGASLWIPYSFVYPWAEFGILCILLLLNWGALLVWMLKRTKTLKFNAELRQERL